MTIDKLMITAAMCALSLAAQAEGFIQDMEVKARLGYNIGGTAPVGLPATIRGLNSYHLQPNVSLGVDAIKPVSDHWGVLIGLRFEGKGMDEDARVKNYHEEIVRGGETLSGRFTGDVTTRVREWMFTVPLQANWSVTPQLDLRMGPYLSILTAKSFSGYAHNGYLRVGDPTGTKVMLGEDETERGNYDFSEHMRPVQWGINLGVDWYGRGRFGVFADINWGLSGVHKSNFKTIEQTLYPIFATMGISYKIR
jgi:hypothetical protein